MKSWDGSPKASFRLLIVLFQFLDSPYLTRQPRFAMFIMTGLRFERKIRSWKVCARRWRFYIVVSYLRFGSPFQSLCFLVRLSRRRVTIELFRSLAIERKVHNGKKQIFSSSVAFSFVLFSWCEQVLLECRRLLSVRCLELVVASPRREFKRKRTPFISYIFFNLSKEKYTNIPYHSTSFSSVFTWISIFH